MNNEIIKYTTLESDRNRWQTTNQKHNANSITSISNEVSRRNRSLGLRTFHKISTLAQLRNLFNKTNTLQNWDKRILQPSYQSRSVFRSLERKREKERERERERERETRKKENSSDRIPRVSLDFSNWKRPVDTTVLWPFSKLTKRPGVRCNSRLSRDKSISSDRDLRMYGKPYGRF